MHQHEMEQALLRYGGCHPGYEYTSVDCGRVSTFGPDGPYTPPDGEGWELDVDAFPEGQYDTAAGVREYEHADGIYTTTYWRRRVREVDLETLTKAVLDNNLHTDYEYTEFKSPAVVEYDGADSVYLRMTDQPPHLEFGWSLHNKPNGVTFSSGVVTVSLIRPLKNSKRLIIAPNLDLVRRLHAVIGGPEPVEYSDYAQEHGMYLHVTGDASSSWGLEEVARSTSKTVEVFTNPELEFNLYAVVDESTYPHPPHDQPDGGWIWPSAIQKPVNLPWGPKASFLTDQLWLIGSNGFAYNLRDRKCETGAKIDLNAPASA